MSRLVQLLRNHLSLLLIVPLVVIVTTWPTFPRIFDADEFWLHGAYGDKWLRIWDVWHFERALAGQTPLYHTDAIFYPVGTSLTYYAMVFPHALLMIALQTILPVDDAYNLLFLLILCFNAFCGYALIRHLIMDKWIALFGAVIFAVATPFPVGQTVPDLITIGTLPLTIYFYDRSLREGRKLFAGLAGISAGITAFIGIYVFAIIVITVGIFAAFRALSLWRQPAYWRGLLILICACGFTSAWRFYPMLLNLAELEQATGAYNHWSRSNDLLEHFVLPNNPITGHLFGEPLDPNDDYERSAIRKEFKEAYLGYINLFLIACLFLLRPRWGRLLPWLAILLFFAVLRLGDNLVFNGIEYEDITLPAKLLRLWFPPLFGNIGLPEYYQIGVVTPLAALSCYGLAALLRSKGGKTRRLIALLCILIVCIEFYIPRLGQTIAPSRTAFVAWLRSEPEDQIALVHLPRKDADVSYYYYLQTLSGYPHANGFSTRAKRNSISYRDSNLLLRAWGESRSIHCLKYNEESFTAALDQLLADGFTHFVMHYWLYGAEFIIDTLENVPPAYDDGSVSVYRVSDLRLSCQNQAAELPRFIHFAQSALAMPGAGTSIFSLHPSQAIDSDLFDYLGSLFSEWRSLVHLYSDDGEVVIQSAGQPYTDSNAVMEDNQVVYFLYNTHEADPDLLIGNATFDGFNLCQREAHDDGAVIELYIRRGFSCELVTAGDPLQVRYDNGIRLENLLVQTDQDVMDFQFMWSGLPDEAHSISLQVFDAAGEKVLGQDSVIGHLTLDRQRVDISSLPPGDYRVKLILYNFDTGAIVSGTASRDGARVERALEVAAIHQS